MANESTNRRSPNRKSFISAILEVIFNIILIAILSWFLLILWFSFKTFVLCDESISDLIRQIVDINHESLNHKIKILKTIESLQYSIILNFKYDLIKKLLLIISGSTKVVVVKTFVLIRLVPFYAVILFIFITDGLVQRDIRKFQGARESSFFFHTVKSKCISIFLYFIFVYMALPYPVKPQYLLIPMVFLTAFCLMLSIKSYKKYL